MQGLKLCYLISFFMSSKKQFFLVKVLLKKITVGLRLSRKKISIIGCISLCLISSLLFGQKPNIKFNTISTKEGLSQVSVMCILQDSRGFMWFGTRDGLNRYDGYKFKVYKNVAKDPTSISGNFIQTIY